VSKLKSQTELKPIHSVPEHNRPYIIYCVFAVE